MSDPAPPSRTGEPNADPAHESALDGFLRLATRVLRVDRCVLGLASPRDGWMRSVLGVPRDEARGLIGFCSFAMMQDQPAVVADARSVAPLSLLPAVQAEDGYRFLACAPIVSPVAGKRGGLAALCRSPRAWSQEDAELFAMLCAQAGAIAEEQRLSDELRRRGQHQADLLSMLRGVLKASTTFAVLGTDRAGRIKLFSEGAERLFGVPAREAIGRTPEFLLVAPDQSAQGPPSSREDAALPDLLAELTSGVVRAAPVERTWLVRRSDGSVFPASITTACVTAEGGELAGYAFIARDVSEQRAIERMKDDFVSMVSHELRTPLTSIRGALGLLLGDVAGPLSPEVEELVDIAQANTGRLLRVVNDILDLQRLSTGGIELAVARIDLHAAAERAIELLGPVSAAREVTCSLVRRAPSGGLVDADFDRVVQVLVNFLSNAVRYSPPSSRVRVDVDDLESSVRVSVEDEGPGIPEDFRARLFQKFARASTGAGAPSGTGLGLSIVKAILDLHGGTVAFHPALPHGAVFSFELPRPAR
jgi:PAS domain S-box-containing protein